MTLREKHLALSAALLVSAVILAGCFNKVAQNAGPAAEGDTYDNKDLGFSLVVPKELEYWQIQRKNQEKFVDIELFVPTSDLAYPKEVPGYAKPFVIRVYQDAAAPDQDFLKLGEKGKRQYGIRFWQAPPQDWREVWQKELETKIIESFKMK